jgi:heme-degrading monooxygenase HmoA
MIGGVTLVGGHRVYVVHNRIEVPIDATDAFEKVFVDNMAKNLAGVPGLLRSTLLKPAGDERTYVSTMEFDSKDAFLAWLKSDSFKASHSNDQAAGMLGPSAIESFTVLEDIQA